MPAHPSGAESIDFDEGNESELARHRITLSEVMQIALNDPTWAPNKKGRAATWIAVGYTDGGRALTIPMLYDGRRRVLRPITGWDCSEAERARYLK